MNTLEPTTRNLPAKIREFNGSLQLKQAIKIILDEVIGDYALNIPHPEQESRNVSFVIDNYPDMEPKEIGKAFEMNASGKHWETVRKYSDMSTLFIGEVMIKYIQWKQIQNIRNPDKHIQQIHFAPSLTPSERLQRHFNRQIDQRQLYGDNYQHLDWHFIYEFALRCGMYHNREEVKAVMARIKKEQPDAPHSKRKIEAMKFLFKKYYREEEH